MSLQDNPDKFPYYLPESNGAGREKMRSVIKNLGRKDVAPEVKSFVFRAYLRPQIPVQYFKMDGHYQLVKDQGPHPPQAPRYQFMGRQRKAGRWLSIVIKNEYHHADTDPTQEDNDVENGPFRETKLEFMKLFRGKLEKSDTVDELERKIDAVIDKNPRYGVALEDFDGDVVRFYFVSKLGFLPGVGEETARTLYRHGFKSLKIIDQADPSTLMDVPGIGEVTANEIFDHLDQRIGDDWIGID